MEERQTVRSRRIKATEPTPEFLERPARSTPAHALVGDSHYQLPDAPLLSREQELSLASDIEALEVAHWCALLSYAPALPSVASAVSQCLPRPCPTLQEGAELTPAARQALATELRGLDVERTALRETDLRVRSIWQNQTGARAQAYLARIDRARAAEQRVKSRFVASNLRLVVRLARAYANGALDKADLIQEGSIGLMRAVERFDHRRGLRFSTYASWWIRHHLNRAIADKSRLVRVPVHAAELHRRVRRAQQKHITRYGVPPSAAELADMLGLPVDAIEDAATSAHRMPKSLDQPMHGDSERTMHDVLVDPDQLNVEHDIIQSDRARALAASLRVLTSFEAAVVRFRYGLDGEEALTLREVGEKYNLSRERIRQVQEVALAKLRGCFEHDDSAAVA